MAAVFWRGWRWHRVSGGAGGSDSGRHCSIRHVTDSTVPIPTGGAAPAFAVYKSSAPDSPARFRDKFTMRALQDFVQIEALEPMVEFKKRTCTKSLVTPQKLHQILLFTDPSADYHEGTVSAMSEAYSSYKGSCVNVMVDATLESSSKVLNFVYSKIAACHSWVRSGGQ